MGIKVGIIKDGLTALAKTSEKKYVGALKPAFKIPSKNEDLLCLTYKTSEKRLNKTGILTEYCNKNNLVPDDLIKQFDSAGLDEVSKEHLLRLTENGKISLYTPPRVKKNVYISNRNANDSLQISDTEGLLNYVSGSSATAKEAAMSLKELLALEKEGKISAENIAELLKMHSAGYGAECREFTTMLRKGEAAEGNIQQVLLMVENGIPLEVLNPKTLSGYSKKELGYFAKVLQASRKELPPELLSSISKELQVLVKVNRVPKAVSNKFLTRFEQNTNVFASSRHSIDDLAKAGGVQLQYSRQSFKDNILSQIKHLSDKEQNEILSKFGLQKESNGIMSGFPVLIEDSAKLSPVEASVNKEIKRFLTENRIILPEGFEGYQAPLESICKTFPEFMFTIGSKQHNTHSKYLAEHMLMAMQENMKNPLYKNLSASDKKVLGISTLLHDLNKIERTKDPMHPMTTSLSVNSIVQRMEGLTTTEKNRIINFVENHHWLMKVKDAKTVEPEVVKELAFKFRHGNDFEMAKIFAESDLKAVNEHFFTSFGGKIDSATVKAVEEKILEIQSKGKMVFTTDITLDRAIQAGAKQVSSGTGQNTTRNWVIGAKELGLDTENVIYHASDDAGLICAAGSCGYGKKLVLSASLGRKGHCGTYGKSPEFLGFRQMDMGNIGSAFRRNTKFGKGYGKMQDYALSSNEFVSKVKAQYPISDEQYAKVFKEVSCNNLKLSEIHSNENIQRILGGEAKAKEFESAIKNVNKELESSMNDYQEVVIMDPELGFIGTKRGIDEISYNLKKFCEDNNILIVDFR